MESLWYQIIFDFLACTSCYDDYVFKEVKDMGENFWWYEGDTDVVESSKEEEKEQKEQSNLLPTGMEKIKIALQGAIAHNNAVKDFIVQTAAAEESMRESLPSKISNQKTTESFCVKFRRQHEYDPVSSESDFDEDIEEEVPAAPTRRSSRTSRGRKSYKEISSGEEFDETEVRL